jgi:hypothetical protein
MIILAIVLTFVLMVGMALGRNNMLKIPVVVLCYLSILVLIQLYFEQ